MRVLISKIDALGDLEKFAFYDLAAHTLAAQAIAAASAAGVTLSDANVRKWIEAAADYPGMMLLHLNEEKTLLLGDRAVEIAKFLLRAGERVKTEQP